MVRRITVKQLKDGWSLSFGHTPRKRRDASTILNAIERRLCACANDTKGLSGTKVVVVYLSDLKTRKRGDRPENVTLTSTDPNYLLYTTSCFLEDYLSADVQRRYQKTYLWIIKTTT